MSRLSATPATENFSPILSPWGAAVVTLTVVPDWATEAIATELAGTSGTTPGQSSVETSSNENSWPLMRWEAVIPAATRTGITNRSSVSMMVSLASESGSLEMTR